MKKTLKLYEGRTLTADVGKIGAYNHQRMVISASEKNGGHIFRITRYSSRGHESDMTDSLETVIATMKAFAPRASAWKVSRKEKAAKPAKVKATKEVAQAAAIKKGRG